MKIKTDFVTNSSSVSFIIVSESKMTKKDFPFKFLVRDTFRSFKSKKALISFCQAIPCDWINLITGPSEFWNIREGHYDKMLEAINDGKYAICADLDRDDWDRIKRFQDIVKKEGGIIVASGEG